jgi:hypothetical protein
MGFLRVRHRKEACVEVALVSGVRDRERLRRIVDETVLLQGLADDLLAGIRQRRSLSELARPGGALIDGFLALRADVPSPSDPGLREIARVVRETLDHHAMMLSFSLRMLGDLRPERVSDQLDKLDGLGAPAQRLCALQDRLTPGARRSPRPSRP